MSAATGGRAVLPRVDAAPRGLSPNHAPQDAVTRGPGSRTFRAMASVVRLQVVDPAPGAESALDAAEAVFREVERTCSRFDAASALSRANAAPGEWHEIPQTLARAVAEAERAHHETQGLFDPRIHDTLVAWGYDRSLPFAEGGVERAAAPVASGTAAAPAHRGPWQPGLIRSGGRHRLHLGGTRIDLGGIGKGLAVRWAAARLADAGAGVLADAGGDVALAGRAPDGGLWRVGVEDPAGSEDPLLVLALTDSGCATSSTRLRRWRADGTAVHHLVDPRTGRPGGAGLAAVTVALPDAAWSEVWSKALFLLGVEDAQARAEESGLAAAWVDDAGAVGTSSAMTEHLLWRREERS